MLVDLAMISATGQGDLEVHRVKCLQGAAMGYGPLIYNLKTTDGLKEFLSHCNSVWKTLEADPELPRKLVCGQLTYCYGTILF